MFVKQESEIGSLDINGSVRGFFEHCDYSRSDIGPRAREWGCGLPGNHMMLLRLPF